MIDDLTIAAKGSLESPHLGRRAELGDAAPRLSIAFGDLLHKSASLSEDEPSALSAKAAPGEDPRTPAVRDSDFREVPDHPEDNAISDARTEGDPARSAGREDIPPDRHGDYPANSTEPDRFSSGRDEANDAPSEARLETAGDAPAIGDGLVLAVHNAGPKNASATSPSQGPRGAIPTLVPNTATPPETAIRLDESLPKPARANPPGAPGPNSAQGPQTTAPAETTAATQRQAGGLAKAIGNGGKAQVSVNVVKEAETLVSQPSFTLASAAAIVRDGSRPNPRIGGNNGQTDTHSNGTLQPTAARVQPQTAASQQTPAQARVGATAQATPSGEVPGNTAGSPVAPTDTTGGDTSGLANVTNSLRGTAPTATQAIGTGKLETHHRPVADQISVNISKAVKAGMDRIEIRLTPESLGRVDVRLEVSRDGRVAAAVTVDNRDTLELLKIDARGLERALQDAGLKTDSGNLSFNLRGHDTTARHGGGSAPNVSDSETGNGGDEDGDEPSAAPSTAYPRGGVMPDGRIDIRA